MIRNKYFRGYKYTPYFGTDYDKAFLYPPLILKAVKKCIRTIQSKKLKFDAIAFRGVSGAIIAPMVALELRKTLIVVRKDRSHSQRPVDGDRTARSYIIIDDFISSGQTVRKIVTTLNKWQEKPKCKGVVLYNAVLSFRKVKDNGDLWTR